jgi:hypothetical protein
VALSHFLPRRWTLQKGYSGLASNNAVAIDRSWSDLYRLWEFSPMLRQLRLDYGKSGLASKIMNVTQDRVFQAEPYAQIPKAIRYHIMYSLLFLDFWRSYGASKTKLPQTLDLHGSKMR